MHTEDQLEQFKNRGYLLIEDMFLPQEIDILRKQIDSVNETPGVVYEDNNSREVRSLNGVHKYNPVFAELCCHPKLLKLAKDILQSDVYVHQFKINLKKAFDGDIWEWHQDHIYWLKEDGMIKPDAFTAAIFLTESNEFNSPIMLIPGSHHAGTADIPAIEDDNIDGWQSNFLKRTKYPAPKEFIRQEATKNGMYSAKASPGSVLVFHSDVLHGSTKNMSPYDREIIFIAYNSVNNKLQNTDNPRPDFLANRDYTPLRAITNSAYFQL